MHNLGSIVRPNGTSRDFFYACQTDGFYISWLVNGDNNLLHFSKTSLVGSTMRGRSSNLEYVAILLAAYPHHSITGLTTLVTFLVVSNVLNQEANDFYVQCIEVFRHNASSCEPKPIPSVPPKHIQDGILQFVLSINIVKNYTTYIYLCEVNHEVLAWHGQMTNVFNSASMIGSTTPLPIPRPGIASEQAILLAQGVFTFTSVLFVTKENVDVKCAGAAKNGNLFLPFSELADHCAPSYSITGSKNQCVCKNKMK